MRGRAASPRAQRVLDAQARIRARIAELTARLSRIDQAPKGHGVRVERKPPPN
jgi:hypothetical protein